MKHHRQGQPWLTCIWFTSARRAADSSDNQTTLWATTAHRGVVRPECRSSQEDCMKTQPATPVASAPSGGVMNWHDLDWATIQQAVRKTQLKIAQATQEGNWRRVKRLQRMLTYSFYGRCLAVRRVTENRGRKTPGVDGETWGSPQAKLRAVGSLSKQRDYRPKPLRRVWIPKPGKHERRPLGIPCLLYTSPSPRD